MMDVARATRPWRWTRLASPGSWAFLWFRSSASRGEGIAELRAEAPAPRIACGARDRAEARDFNLNIARERWSREVAGAGGTARTKLTCLRKPRYSHPRRFCSSGDDKVLERAGASAIRPRWIQAVGHARTRTPTATASTGRSAAIEARYARVAEIQIGRDPEMPADAARRSATGWIAC